MGERKKVQRTITLFVDQHTWYQCSPLSSSSSSMLLSTLKFPIDSLFVKMVFNEFFFFFSSFFSKCFYLFMLTFTQIYYIKCYCFQIWLLLIGILLFSFFFFDCLKTINNFAEIHWWKFINVNKYECMKKIVCLHTHTNSLTHTHTMINLSCRICWIHIFFRQAKWSAKITQCFICFVTKRLTQFED